MSSWQLMLTRTLSFRHQLFIKLFASAGCHAVCLESPLCPPWLSKPVGMPSLLMLACYKALSPKLGVLPIFAWNHWGMSPPQHAPSPEIYQRSKSHGLGPLAQKDWACVSVSRIIGKWLLRSSKLLLFSTPLVSMQGLCPGVCTPVSSNNLGTHSLLHVCEKGARFRSPGSTIWEGNSVLIFHFWYCGLNGYLTKLLRG